MVTPRVDPSRLLALWLAALATFFVARLLFVDWLHLGAAYDTDYETGSFASTEVLWRGLNPYAAEVYAAPPFVLTMYTPAYFGLAALLGDAPHPFFGGRLITAVSLLIIGALLVATARRRALGGLLFGGVCGLWFVLENAAQYRPDMMAIACAAGAVVAARRPTTRRLIVAALLVLVALATKQNSVASGAAIVVSLVLRAPTRGLRFAGALLGAGLVLLVAFHIGFGPGFWTSTLEIPAMGQFSLPHGLQHLARMARQPFCVPFVASVLVFVWGRRGPAGNDDSPALSDDPALWWALFATLVQGVGLFREGSSVNYGLEPILAWCFVAARSPLRVGGRARSVLLLIVGLLGTSDLVSAPARTFSAVSVATDEARRQYKASLRATVRQLAGSDALVVHPQFSRHAVEVSRHVVINDPWLYGDAWRRGLLPQEAFETALATHHFDVVMLSTERGPRGAHAISDEVLLPMVRAHYQLAHRDAAFEYWVPRAAGDAP
jgi:hypothetical protein